MIRATIGKTELAVTEFYCHLRQKNLPNEFTIKAIVSTALDIDRIIEAEHVHIDLGNHTAGSTSIVSIEFGQKVKGLMRCIIHCKVEK